MCCTANSTMLSMSNTLVLFFNQHISMLKTCSGIGLVIAGFSLVLESFLHYFDLTQD